jgi:signal transduction histidine kinase
MSRETADVVERSRALLGRASSAAQRALAGPDGPLALALVLAFAAMLEVTVDAEEVGVAMVANLLATLPVAFVRRSLPWATGATVFGVVTALSGDTAKLTVAGVLALAFVAYLFAARYRRRWSILVALPFLANAIVPFSGSEASASAVLLLVVVVAALALGDARGQRGQAIAERDEAQRDRAVTEERARIARELHDVVAHHVSMIAVQAETARLTTPDLTEEGRQRFEAIGAAARDSLTELRRLLGVLRKDAGGEAERAPQPGLDGLEALLDTAREAGTPIRLTMSGRSAALPPGVDLTAYRIVQEALTNARRHAPGAQVDVELRYDSGALHVEVRDHGPGPTIEPAGHGIVGMRERAAMVGGTLETGPADGGGFAVRAELPIGEPPP